MQTPPCTCTRDQMPSQAALAQAVVELTGAALGKREHVARAAALRVTEADKAEFLDQAAQIDSVVEWLRAHYA